MTCIGLNLFKTVEIISVPWQLLHLILKNEYFSVIYKV